MERNILRENGRWTNIHKAEIRRMTLRHTRMKENWVMRQNDTHRHKQ